MMVSENRGNSSQIHLSTISFDMKKLITKYIPFKLPFSLTDSLLENMIPTIYGHYPVLQMKTPFISSSMNLLRRRKKVFFKR